MFTPAGLRGIVSCNAKIQLQELQEAVILSYKIQDRRNSRESIACKQAIIR